MIARIREMPAGLRLFLVYAFTILVVIGLSLRYVVDLAIATPVSLPGLVVMALLAYTIFTITVILQRKQVGRGLALGLSSLTLPGLAFSVLNGLPLPTVVLAVVSTFLFRGLLRGEVRTYLSEP